MSNDYQILEKIETYLLGRMSGEERRAFQEELDKDPELKGEVKAYSFIFEGFRGVQRQELEHKMDEWGKKITGESAGMDLIERYLNRELAGRDLEDFESRLKTDADFAQEVKGYETLLKGFKGMQIKGMEDEIRGWEGKGSAESPERGPLRVEHKARLRRRLYVRVAAAAAILLLIVGGPFFHASSNYSDSAIATTYLKDFTDSGTLGGEDSPEAQFEKIFQEAEAKFENKAYREAAGLFYQASATIEAASSSLDPSIAKSFKELAEWNGLLSLLASGEAGEEPIEKRLEEIANDLAHSFQKEAEELKRDLGSFWRKLVK